ncbi:O-antigen ligase [Blastococcus mobilis]|uniref:O-antigen ligase n=2 Tax=Blastococcus mobilis TaxID=1938746 RepID=A0A238W4B2_9ACTN|nr:O-antigen ligase [Blastococcus mobilis]
MTQGGGAAPVGGLVLRPGPSRRSLVAITDPDVVLGAVLATWILFPASRVPPKIGWALLALSLALVLVALGRYADRLRWSAPATLLLLPGLCAVLSAPRYGSLADLLQTAATTLLLVGCALLAAHCDRRRTDRLIVLVLLVALAELAVAAASAVLGTPAPWGYLGEPGALFGVNELLPAVGGRATGTMAHPIPFGTLMAVASVLALFALPRYGRSVRVAASAGFAAGVLLSGSRSAALVLAVCLVLGWFWPGVARVGAPARLVLVGGVAAALFRVDLAGLTAVSSLAESGSLTHRLGAVDAGFRLLGRPAGELLLGSGAGSLPALFADGLLQQDGFRAVDNQVVTTFALAGLVGVAALLAAVGTGLLRGDRASRPAALVVVLMFLSFDVLQWTAAAVLLAVLIPLGTARPTSADVGEDPHGGWGHDDRRGNLAR